jgi:hypothetical protein
MIRLHLLLCARVGSGIPHAAGRLAIGLGFCRFHIAREGRSGEGQPQSYRKGRYQGFHGVCPFTLDFGSLRKSEPAPVIRVPERTPTKAATPNKMADRWPQHGHNLGPN